jgi:hypothetical protein
MRAIVRLFVLFGFLATWLPDAAQAQRFQLGMKDGSNSAATPQVDGDVVRFTLLPGQCQARTYGDGRGESDCLNMSSKSYLSAGDVSNGSSMKYSFDIRVVAGLTHREFHNPRAVPFTGGQDSRLSVALWQGEYIKNHIHQLDLDATRGLTFLGKTCVRAADIEKWNRFEMLVRWSDTSDGVIQVTCNQRVVYAARNAVTDQQPHCHISNHCEPGVVKHPKRINAGFGLFFDAEYVNGVRTRPRVPASGLVIEMRNLESSKVRLQ